MKALIFFLCSLIATVLNAQFSDDFSDGDFTTAPAWLGDANRFVVNAGELQLKDDNPASDNVAYLSVPAATTAAPLTSWEFLVKLDFAPSTANFPRIYLNASNSDLTGPNQGYYLRIGGITGTNDALELFRQDGNSHTALLAGSPGAVGGNPAVARVRITRDGGGNWTLLADYTGGEDFQPEGVVIDNTYPEGLFFGFFCRYSSSRSEAFFFDDVRIDPYLPDISAPQLLMVQPLSATEIMVRFDEEIEPAAATDPTRFTLSDGIGTPLSATPEPGAPTDIRLLLGSPLTDQTTYSLTADNIPDLSGNSSGPQTVSFTFFDIQPAAAGDLIITEIMADPTPVVGLPEAEFLECYNRSNKTLQLSDLRFDSGSTPQPLSSFILLPDHYVILCDAAHAPLLTPFGDVVIVPDLPALANTGDELNLTNVDGELIHRLVYDDSWYQDPDRDDGGHSLELIDPLRRPDCRSNWRASRAPAGGTPGGPNSVSSLFADLTPPQLLGATPAGEEEILLVFDEPLDEISATEPGRYQLSGGPAVIEALLLGEGDRLLLFLDAPLALRTFYTLTIGEGLEDCLGNAAAPLTTDLARGEEIAAGDLLITEIMAAPEEESGLPDAEYIELYNPSEKFLQLEDLQFSTGGSPRSLPSRLLLPGHYLVLTDNEAVAGFQALGPVAGLSNFPALTNSGDDLRLSAPNGETLLTLTYDRRWYQDDEKAGGGWSLEMIDLEGPPDCRHNWRASLNERGGTPGQPNSVTDAGTIDGPIELLGVFPEDDNQLRLNLSRALDTAAAANPAVYSLTPPLGISNARALAPAYDSVRIQLTEGLDPTQIYRLTLSSSLADCLGNGPGDRNELLFGIPEAVAPGDLVINELLFYPQPGGTDFLELFNRSDKVINLKDMDILNLRKASGSVSTRIAHDYLILPGAYAVLTEAPADLQSRYAGAGPEAYLLTNLPSFDNDAGNVTLRQAGVTIDSFDYDESLHFGLLSSTRGVSLERLDPEAATNSSGNWHSAAATAGFATPGLPNSNLTLLRTDENTMISLPEKTFSPDGDGFQETLTIAYQVDQPGYVLNLQVFDALGRPVRQLVRNQSLALSGSFKWDGVTDEGRKARMGIYVLMIELFRPDGRVVRDKLSCVLAGRLE